jgi:UDP-N-acetylmuramate--alanine ligase
MKIYCSGIGGIGLSAYAGLQCALGHDVSGSDYSESPILEDLRSQGINIDLVQDGSNVKEGIDLFVYSEAVPYDSPERSKARELGIKCQSYFQALGELSKDYEVIAVCGTHGKSSTVAMAARVLMDANKDPTVVVGTKLKELEGRNWRKGEGNLFLLEACEYRRSFHFLLPDCVLMTNVDGDHFDAYSSIDEYQQAFVDFLKLLPEDGRVITHGSDEDCRTVTEQSGQKIDDVDTMALPSLGVPGLHMRENAQLVIALALKHGISLESAQTSLLSYTGCWRRMEYLGIHSDGVAIVDDYAHHPREIRATIQAAKEEYPERKILAVFQPHMHNRTLALYDDFTESFSGLDQLIVLDVYDARNDTETEIVDLPAFILDIKKRSNVNVVHGGTLDNCEKILHTQELSPQHVLLFMGAGDITELAHRFSSFPQ